MRKLRLRELSCPGLCSGGSGNENLGWVWPQSLCSFPFSPAFIWPVLGAVIHPFLSRDWGQSWSWSLSTDPGSLLPKNANSTDQPWSLNKALRLWAQHPHLWNENRSSSLLGPELVLSGWPGTWPKAEKPQLVLKSCYGLNCPPQICMFPVQGPLRR